MVTKNNLVLKITKNMDFLFSLLWPQSSGGQQDGMVCNLTRPAGWYGWGSEALDDGDILLLVLIDSCSMHTAITIENAFFLRKDTSMPIRASTFFDMFPFCILYEVSVEIIL